MSTANVQPASSLPERLGDWVRNASFLVPRVVCAPGVQLSGKLNFEFNAWVPCLVARVPMQAFMASSVPARAADAMLARTKPMRQPAKVALVIVGLGRGEQASGVLTCEPSTGISPVGCAFNGFDRITQSSAVPVGETAAASAMHDQGISIATEVDTFELAAVPGFFAAKRRPWHRRRIAQTTWNAGSSTRSVLVS